MKNIIVLHTTVSTLLDAQKISKILLEEKLIGCAQIDGPLESIYTWKNAIETDKEFRLSVKTTSGLSQTVMEMIEQHHPYEVPEIIGSKLDYCSAGYQDWLIQEVDNDRS